MFGFDTYFITNASSATLSARYIENQASGRIVLGGELNLRPVISTNYLWALRDNTRKSSSANQYMTALKWEKFGTRVMAEYDLSAVTQTATSLVSFGTGGVVVQ